MTNHPALTGIAAHLRSKGLPSADADCLVFAVEQIAMLERRVGWNIKLAGIRAQIAGDGAEYFGLSVAERAQIYGDNKSYLQSLNK